MIAEPVPHVQPRSGPICPHGRAPRLGYIPHPLSPDDPQLDGLSPCERAEAVATFAAMGIAYAVRVAEANGDYDEAGRLRLTIAELEEELLRLRHEAHLPPWKHWRLAVARVLGRRKAVLR